MRRHERYKFLSNQPQKIIDFKTNRISINDLENFVCKTDPALIYGKNGLLENKNTQNLGLLADIVQDYSFYKKNGDENLVLDHIDDYYSKFLKRKK